MHESSKLKDFDTLLSIMVNEEASDLFITVGLPPTFKIHGKTVAASSNKLTSEQVDWFADQIMDDKQKQDFNNALECNFAIDIENSGRFRVNVFQQKNHTGMVLRKIQTDIPGLSELGLPHIISELTMAKRGLTIIAGPTGTGKSTSLAAMIGMRNQQGSGHIITIEDPIEFIHEHNNCVITQREVGVDTKSYESALKNALRQAPDVILIGEIRSQETMQHAIAFAETGHLCLATLHANNANQALERIVNFFPEDRHKQILMDLSLNLNAIVAQQLVPSVDQSTRSLAVEILLNTPLIADLIIKGEFGKLKAVMKKSTPLGMQTFEHALYELYENNYITLEDALHFADETNELRLMIKLANEGKRHGIEPANDRMTLLGRNNF